MNHLKIYNQVLKSKNQRNLKGKNYKKRIAQREIKIVKGFLKLLLEGSEKIYSKRNFKICILQVVTHHTGTNHYKKEEN